VEAKLSGVHGRVYEFTQENRAILSELVAWRMGVDPEVDIPTRPTVRG
jgi:hypothetical protein